VTKTKRFLTLSPEHCRDEAAFSGSMMDAINTKFQVGKNLSFAFIDSWAKHPMNLDDQVPVFKQMGCLFY
jgi:hypothetical protein